MGKPTLLDMLCNIMELDKPMEEANRKLRKTYMIVNGIVLKVSDFDIPYNIIHYINPNSGDVEHVKVDTLQVFLPETGLYPLSNGQLLYVNKVPKRQWNKSFTFEYYSADNIGEMNPKATKYRAKEQVLTEICYSKPSDIAIDYTGNIYYGSNVIGVVLNSKEVICNHQQYEQELIDWCKL